MNNSNQFMRSHSMGVHVSSFCPAKQTRDIGIPKFLRQLYIMLTLEDGDIVGWVNNGTVFKVMDPKIVSETILPKYFRHGRYTSFQRQLNYFGFRKISQSGSSNVAFFSHPNFIKYDPSRISFIRRRSNSGTPKPSSATAYIDSLNGNSKPSNRASIHVRELLQVLNNSPKSKVDETAEKKVILEKFQHKKLFRRAQSEIPRSNSMSFDDVYENSLGLGSEEANLESVTSPFDNSRDESQKDLIFYLLMGEDDSKLKLLSDPISENNMNSSNAIFLELDKELAVLNDEMEKIINVNQNMPFDDISPKSNFPCYSYHSSENNFSELM